MGIDGGYAAGGTDFVDIGFIEETLPIPETNHHEVHFAGLYDALLHPASEGKHPECRLLYIVGCNLLNQNLNLNKGRKALQKVDFVVTHELFLTPPTRFADIVLPVSNFMEREDIGQPFIGGPYCIHMNKILDPLEGVKSDVDIFSEIARRVGIDTYNDRSDEQWLETFLESEPGFPHLDTLRQEGVHRFEMKHAHVAFSEQVKDPDENPFPTPSGKIEIFSNRFAEMNNPDIPPIPTYMPSWEGADDPLTGKFPYSL